MKTQTCIYQFKRILLSGLVAVFILNSFTGIAGDFQQVTIGKKITLKSSVLDEERTLLIYTPNDYDLSTSSYPVIYLLDGDFHFHHATGIVDFLATQGKMPQAIVVAIVNVDRNRDFTPTKIAERPASGGAARFTRFISDELKPYIHKQYRTEPFNILVGHSLGGTFAAYTLLTNPGLFDAYIAISPYLAYDDSFVVNRAGSDLRAAFDRSKFFYMTLGNEPGYFEPVGKFAQIIKNSSPKGLEFTYVSMPKEDHGSIPHLSIYQGLEAIYTDWKLPANKYDEGITALDSHYKMLSDKYDYTIQTPEHALNILGYNYLHQRKDNEGAIEIFKENVKRYPHSANVYDSLGDAYETDGKVSKARENYEKAVNLAEKNNHPFLEVYKKNLLRMELKMAEK